MNIIPFTTVFKRFDDYILYDGAKSSWYGSVINTDKNGKEIQMFIQSLTSNEKHFIWKIVYYAAQNIVTGSCDYDMIKNLLKKPNMPFASFNYLSELTFNYHPCLRSNEKYMKDVLSLLIEFVMTNNLHEKSLDNFMSTVTQMPLSEIKINSDVHIKDTSITITKLENIFDKIISDEDGLFIHENYIYLHIMISLFYMHRKSMYVWDEQTWIFDMIDKMIKKGYRSFSDYVSTTKSKNIDTIDDEHFAFLIHLPTASDREVMMFLRDYYKYYISKVGEKVLMKSHFYEYYLQHYIDTNDSSIDTDLDKRCSTINTYSKTLYKLVSVNEKEQVDFLKNICEKKRKITDTMIYQHKKYNSMNLLIYGKGGNKNLDVLATTLNRIKIGMKNFDNLMGTLKHRWDVNDTWLLTNLAEKLNDDYSAELLRLYMTR